MSEENAQPNLQLAIQRIYVKDLSFESPNAPEIFGNGDWKPELNLNLGTETKKLGDNQFEIVLKVTVTVKAGDESSTAFLVEVHQAGIFSIQGLPDEQLGPVFGIVCPNILFPYAREAVSDLVNRGGFPQLLLAPVNFEALYQQHLQQQQSKAAEQH